jgi:hypothetical protein
VLGSTDKDMPIRARVQAHRLSSVLALYEGVPRAMDHHSSDCLPVEKFPTFASVIVQYLLEQGTTTRRIHSVDPVKRKRRSRDVAERAADQRIEL